MPLIRADRVKETSTTTGTGSITLGGAVTGFRTFDSVADTNDTVNYVIDNGLGEWEVGVGTFTSPSTLARTTVTASSNANSAVNFSAGDKQVALTFVASDVGTVVADLDDLTDVVITSPATDQVIKYNGSSWVNGAAAGGGASYTLEPVRVATTANGVLATAFENGDTIDGVVLATGNRILIKNQTTATENGVYVVQATGAPTRATDFTTGAATLTGGVIVPVINGTISGGLTYKCLNTTAITIGSTAPVFGLANGGGAAGPAQWTAAQQPVISAANTIAIGKNARSGQGSGSLCIGTYSSQPTATGGLSMNLGSCVPSSVGNSTMMIGFGNASISGSFSVFLNVGSNSSSCDGLYNINIGNNGETSLPGQTLIGSSSKAYTANEFVTGSFGFAGKGDVSTSTLRFWTTSTSATAVEIGTTGDTNATTPTNRLILSNDSSYIFDCDIVARNTATDAETAAYNLKFCIRRGAAAANTALVGTPVLTVIGEDTGTTGWDVGVTADTTNGRPKIEVTGEAAKTIRWVANIRMTKVSG